MNYNEDEVADPDEKEGEDKENGCVLNGGKYSFKFVFLCKQSITLISNRCTKLTR